MALQWPDTDTEWHWYLGVKKSIIIAPIYCIIINTKLNYSCRSWRKCLHKGQILLLWEVFPDHLYLHLHFFRNPISYIYVSYISKFVAILVQQYCLLGFNAIQNQYPYILTYCQPLITLQNSFIKKLIKLL